MSQKDSPQRPSEKPAQPAPQPKEQLRPIDESAKGAKHFEVPKPISVSDSRQPPPPKKS